MRTLLLYKKMYIYSVNFDCCYFQKKKEEIYIYVVKKKEKKGF